MGKSRVVSRGATVAFWWFMVVSQHPGGILTTATQGPFATQAQCEWGRQQIAVTTGLRGPGSRLGLDPVLERSAVGATPELDSGWTRPRCSARLAP